MSPLGEDLRRDHYIAADSNALTYFTEAMWNGYDPNSDSSSIAGERAAMLLAYLYTGRTYSLLPTVEVEYKEIRDQSRLAAHEEVAGTLFLDVLDQLPAAELERRQADLMLIHSRPSDCAILAEAELVGVSYLLSCDDAFVSRLRGKANRVRLMKPSEYWNSLAIPPRAQPVLTPKASNPMTDMNWWRL